MMKITKEEKQLYKLLDVINKIFGRTSDRTYIIGDMSCLYFYTLGYCGLFKSYDNNETLIDAYDFGRATYELKQLPNKEYVLDLIDNYCDFEPDVNHVINFIEKRLSGEWKMELGKSYEHKIAKIAAETGKWLMDDDMFILKAFDYYAINSSHDSLNIAYENQYCEIDIILTDGAIGPDIADSTQMKTDAYENNQGLDNKIMEAINNNPPAEELPEEFEDEEFIEESFDDEDDDPMA